VDIGVAARCLGHGEQVLALGEMPSRRVRVTCRKLGNMDNERLVARLPRPFVRTLFG
jgi:hypothetical protein